MSLIDVERLRERAEVEFADIVVEAFSPGINELRIILSDGSFVDVWFSLKLQGRYSFHWERRAIDGTVYRHDNAPHRRWEAVATYPRHFHNGSETNVLLAERAVQYPQAAVAVRLQRAHAQRLGQGQGLTVGGCGQLGLRGLAVRVDLAEEPQRSDLVAAELVLAGEVEGLLSTLARLFQAARKQIGLAK